jgi:hypothetical protein
MADDIAGFELAFLLIGAFRQMIDDLHAELAEQGFPEARPGHGFALQAIGPGQVSISALSRRLGVSKQAASKRSGTLQRSATSLARLIPMMREQRSLSEVIAAISYCALRVHLRPSARRMACGTW